MNTTPTLPYLERSAQDSADPCLLVLLHGVGSNEHDLMGLAPWVPARFHVVSLRGPLAMGPGRHGWFAFDVLPDGSRRIDAAQERASRVLLQADIAAHRQRLGVPPQRVVCGGFSQGGIMALSLLLTAPAELQAVCALHSRLLPEVLPHAAAPSALAGKHVWISHGQQDTVIPIAQAERARAHFTALPVVLDGIDVPADHALPPVELQAWRDWLARLPL